MTTEAEYDAKMAREMVPDKHEIMEPNAICSYNGQVQWFVNKFSIRRDEGCYSQESEVLISHAATMRAMDAAAKAFEEALK